MDDFVLLVSLSMMFVVMMLFVNVIVLEVYIGMVILNVVSVVMVR